MGKIAIVTDSNSGITQDQARELGISVIPMPFYINEKLYLEGITLSQEDFYERLKNDEATDVACMDVKNIFDFVDEGKLVDLRMMRLFLLHSRGRQMYADSGIHYWKSMMK